MIRLSNLFSFNPHGIVGLNARNLFFIQCYNKRELYIRVDDKVMTKQLAKQNGIASPDLIGVVRYHHQLNQLLELLRNRNEFVIKPIRGSEGKGILVITDRVNGLYVKSSGDVLTERGLKQHVSNILCGLHSLGGESDSAMIEQLVHYSDIFSEFSYRGMPDIRIIVFKGYPVMAMMRLPTRKSDGKANLHQGAVGVGIGIQDGKATCAIQNEKPVNVHPDTRAKLSQLSIPNWEEHLTLAARCYEMTRLGYLGVDIVLDRDRGPLLLELNARPGLAIQIANGEGLLNRLQSVELLNEGAIINPENRVEWSMLNFQH
jgi:alpha-L-glutamate ligase-like protein